MIVAVLLVPIIGFTALVVDVAHWQGGAAQLQTGADAAALAGARALQLYPTTAPATVLAYARATTAKNPAFGAPIAITDADLFPKSWRKNATTGVWEMQSATWTTANAVQVRARASASPIFAGIFNRGSTTIERRGTAWIANINGGNCVKPYALEYSVLWRIVNPTSTATPPEPSLTQTQLVTLGTRTNEQRTVVVVRQTLNPAASPGADGIWYPVNFTGNASMSTYRDWVAGTGCTTTTATVGPDLTTVQPSNGNNIPNNTTNGMGSVCQKIAGQASNSALCYDSPTATAPGVKVKIVWASPSAGGGASSAVYFREIGFFYLTCYFTSPSDRCNYSGNVKPTGTWSTATADPALSTGSYPEGTIVGLAQGLSAPVITREDVLGDVVSDQQRLILIPNQ